MMRSPENLPVRSVHYGDDGEATGPGDSPATVPQAALPLQELTWVVLVFSMGTVLYANLPTQANETRRLD